MFAEIFMSVSGSDAGREWVVLYNPCAVPIDFGNYSVAWGDDNFDGAVDLVGTVGAGECFVLGGPTSDAGNFMPVYDQQSEFNPQLWRDFGGLGIYEAAAATVTATSVPVDVFVWGPDNTVGWVDPDGNVAAVTHAAWPADISLRRTAPTTWVEGDPPTPNACPTFSL
jgi:hypothetical protein